MEIENAAFLQKIINLLGYLALQKSDFKDQGRQASLLKQLGLSNVEIASIIGMKSDQVRKVIHAASKKTRVTK